MQRKANMLVVVLLTAFLPGLLQGQGTVNLSLIEPPKSSVEQEARRQRLGARVVGQMRSAVVHVFIWVEKGRTPFKIERPSSGVIVDPSGLVVTHWDLVQEAANQDGGKAEGRSIKVQLHGGKEFAAKIAARHRPSGLVLLQLDPGDAQLSFFELADSRRVVPGEPTIVLGYHEGKENMVFGGVAVHACGGTTVDGEKLKREDILLTDAAIQRQNHGAALVDANGRLVGICNASHVGRDLQEPTLEDLKKPSFGFALPAETIRQAFRPHFKKAKAKNMSLFSVPKYSAEENRRRLQGAATAVAKVAESIVAVYGGDGKRPPIGDMDPYAKKRRKRLGSGVIVDTSGLVLTNAHLVEGEDQVSVTLRNGRSYKADVLDTRKSTNTALLKLELPSNVGVKPIELGNSSKVIPGEMVIGVGSPYGASALTLSVGVLSASRQRLHVTLGKQEESGLWLQADPTLGNHNGGGALVNGAGRLVGIVDGGRTDKLERAARESRRTKEASKLETNLSFVPGINRIRRQFRRLLDEHAGNNDTVATPPRPSKEDLALRSSPVTDVVKKVAGCLVNVYVSWSSKQVDFEDNPFAQAPPRIMTQSLGSGVIITQDGLAMTNWHVVDRATEPTGKMREDHAVHVKLRSGKTYEVKVLSISREDDLALLQLKLAPGEKVDAIEFGDSDALVEGETVIAIGNPQGHKNTVTVGVVTAKNQGIRIKGRWAKFKGLIKTDAAINSGNSGGALLDITGRLVGINSAGGKGRRVTGYAIPVNYVRKKLGAVLLSPKKLRSIHPGMGIGDRDGHPLVLTASRHGPARRAGIMPGDQLLELDGKTLSWSVGLKMLLLERSADRPLEFKVLRQGKQLEVKITPLSSAAWAVFQQTGLECVALPFRQDPKTVRKACIGMHRRFTGDANAEPTSIQESLVQVRRVDEGASEDEMVVKVGDLVLAVELAMRGAAGQTRTLRQFRTVKDVQDCFNSRGIYASVDSSYEGEKFKFWVYRAGKVEVVELTAKRLMY